MTLQRAEIETLKVSELRTMAKTKGIKGYSSLRKQELLDLIQEIDKDNLAKSAEKKRNGIFPDEAWSAMMGSLKNHNYYLSATNLYGVIKTTEMAELLKEYTGNSISVDRITEDIRNNISFAGQYCLYGEYLVSDIYRESNLQGVLELVTIASKYKRYIPDKNEFLKYENGRYYEKTPALDALSEYLVSKHPGLFANNPDGLDTFIRSVHIYCVNQTISDDYTKLCEDFGLKFENEQRAEELQNLVLDVYYNTRLWSKNGHTFAECEVLGEELKSEEHVTFEEISKEFAKKAATGAQGSIKPAIPQKIGRNELCYCGSGKKYKKCCGKNN